MSQERRRAPRQRVSLKTYLESGSVYVGVFAWAGGGFACDKTGCEDAPMMMPYNRVQSMARRFIAESSSTEQLVIA